MAFDHPAPALRMEGRSCPGDTLTVTASTVLTRSTPVMPRKVA
jgi:hypothetical protein